MKLILTIYKTYVNIESTKGKKVQEGGTKMEKRFVYTLKMFMEDYNGFDWDNGKVVIVVDGCPHICEGCWKVLIDKYECREVKRYTHDFDTMVIVL